MAAVSTWPIGEGELATRGDPWSIIVPLREEGEAVDPTTWTWRAQIRATADSPIVAEWTVTTDRAGDLLDDEELTEAGVGADDVIVVMELPPELSARVNDGDQFDLEKVTPAPPLTLWHATIRLRKDISHG